MMMNQIADLYDQIESLESELDQWKRTPVNNVMSAMQDFERFVKDMQSRCVFNGPAHKQHEQTINAIHKFKQKVMG